MSLAALAAAASSARADAPPPLPPMVCVPGPVLERLAKATAARPWLDVAPLMAELLPVLQHPSPCPAVAPPPAPPSEPAPP